MVGSDGTGELALEAGLPRARRVGYARLRLAGREELPRTFRRPVAAGAKEPQGVAHDVTTECGLVDEVVLVRLGGGERRLAVPTFVGHIGAEGARELVATGLGDRVDHATGEAPILGRRAAGDGGGLEDRVLDVQSPGLATDVLVDDDAVDGVEAFPGLCARDRDVVVGSGVRGSRRQQHRLVQGSQHGQLLEGRLLHGRRALSAGAHRLERTGDDDLPLDRLGVYHRVDPSGLGRGHADVVLEGRECRELEPHLVVTGGQALEDVVTLRIGGRQLLALQRRRGHGHGHTRQALILVDNATRQLTRVLRRGRPCQSKRKDNHTDYETRNFESHHYLL